MDATGYSNIANCRLVKAKSAQGNNLQGRARNRLLIIAIKRTQDLSAALPVCAACDQRAEKVGNLSPRWLITAANTAAFVLYARRCYSEADDTLRQVCVGFGGRGCIICMKDCGIWGRATYCMGRGMCRMWETLTSLHVHGLVEW